MGMSHLTITLHVIRSNFNWLLPINLLTPKQNQKAVQNADLMASFAHSIEELKPSVGARATAVQSGFR